MQPLSEDFKHRAVAAPDRILVATDLSDLEFLIPHVVAQAKASAAEVTLLHVISPMLTTPADPSVVAYVDLPQIERNARLAVEEAASQICKRGVACSAMVRRGFPNDVILDVIHAIGAGRLIMGTHGRVRLERLLLGSVATELLAQVEIPMCIIGPYARAHSEHAKPQRILYPVSLRQPSSAQTALDIAQYNHAEITLLHVIDANETSNGDLSRVVQQRAAELDKLIPGEESLWCSIGTQVKIGDRVDEILHTASLLPADLIILGVNAHAPLWPLKGSRTAYRVVAAADCPVLILHHHEPSTDSARHAVKESAAAFIIG